MAATILIVEDSDDFRQLLTMTLDMSGYEVVQAANGTQGLEAARARKFDLVLSDIEMPEMDGVEFVRRFRAIDDSTPIIMLSAADSDLMSKALEAGATGKIIKPFEPIRLTELIEQHLGE